MIVVISCRKSVTVLRLHMVFLKIHHWALSISAVNLKIMMKPMLLQRSLQWSFKQKKDQGGLP